MNIVPSEKFIRSLRFGITRRDIVEYNESFRIVCAEMHFSTERPEQGLPSANAVPHGTGHVLHILMKRGQPLALRLGYMLREGFLEMHADGTLWPSLGGNESSHPDQPPSSLAPEE
jgi:hypothetical protein